MEILKVENLTKIYGKGNTKVTALDNVTFSVEKGEFVAIVGASGSGKSTLLHILGGVDRPTSGKVIVDKEDVYKLNEANLAIFRRRQVGLIYQFYNLIPILNIEENITLPILMNRPAILLADEPTGNLDSKSSKEIIELLKLSNKKYNQTIIMITHDNSLALNADRIITIKDGRIINDERVDGHEHSE